MSDRDAATSHAQGLRVIVAQLGARRRYAVPRMLQAEGALERLYTDLALSEAAKIPRRLREGRLGRRTITGIPAERIWRSPWATLGAALSRARLDVESYLRTDETFGQRMIRWGLGDANTVYGMYGSGSPFWRHARARGVKVACDMYITPMWHEIVLRERINFPDWEAPTADDEREAALFAELNRRCIGAADMILCPSVAVRADLAALIDREGTPKGPQPKFEVVPYGIALKAAQPTSEPVKGRILFAGAAELRKGIHTLAEAERRLNGQARRYEFRVAGIASDAVRTHPKASGLTFLGHLSRAELDAEYAAADLLVLPTLAEGSPAVVHEALAVGLPVVTTRSAGSAVSDGREGRIVPERNPEALADAIAEIVEDRALRAGMSRQALETARNFDEGPWARRLIAALERLHA